ncbi:hypothetical protein I302_106011 [Kwoniella bestiolae CBS 10118]|uniref:UDP-glycosyltransferases domain-containing protein n=1 Tax=Kwoniella bestiolae CBS 10118 TaxID=1296100 RepID=A0AAJ8K9W4_9TREE
MTTSKHFLLAPFGGWGHLRPAISFIPNLLSRSPSSLITILVPVSNSKPASQEFQRYGLDTNDKVKIIHYGAKENAKEIAYTKGNELVVQIRELIGAIGANYGKILKCEPVHDTLLEKDVETHPITPHVAITSITTTQFTVPICEKINKELQKDVKLALWTPTGVEHAAWVMCNLPEGETYRERAKRIFEAPDEEKKKVYNEVLGENEEVVNVPGAAPIYTYEAQPNRNDTFFRIVYPILPILPRVTMIHPYPAFLGQKYKKAAEESGYDVLQIGQQIPADPQIGLPDGPLKQFLDEALEEKGKDSVIYISFGTLYFAPSLEQLSILLDVLISLDKRFILSLGIASPDIQTMVKDKFDSNGQGKGIYVDWAPQLSVLKHEATGWFLTHGGANSVIEAMRARTPMLFWPADIDQVWISNAFSRIHQAGYEFLQIRNGPNIGRKTYTGVKVEGTKQAIQNEFTFVFSSLEDKEFGGKWREGVEELGRKMEDDSAAEEDWRKLVDL